MVYPNRVIENRNWTTNTGSDADILIALGEGDGLYVYTEFLNDNFLGLGMPFEVINCELSVRTDSVYPYPQLLMQFFLDDNLVSIISVPTTNDWTTHTLTVDRWDSVLIEAFPEPGTRGIVGVDFLRAEPFGGLPTRRTLTGVGI